MADMRWSIWDGSHQMGLRSLIDLFQKPHLKPRKTSLLILATQIWGRAARVSPSDANLNNKAKYALKTLTHAKKNIEPGKFWYFVWNFSLKTCRHFWKQLHHCQVQSCTLCSQPSHWTFIVFLVAISMSRLISRSLKVYLNVQWLYPLHHHLRLLHGGLRHLHLGSHRLLGWNRNKSIKWNNINLNCTD